MAKKAKVWDGSAWQDLVNATQDLTPYSTTAQMNTAIAASAGLTLISSQTLSASTGVSFTNVFTSTYTNYRLVFSMYSATNGTYLNIRARMNTTDYTTATGHYCAVNYVSTATGAWNPIATNNANVGYNYLSRLNSTSNTNSIFGIDINPAGTILQYGGTGADGYYNGGNSVIGGIITASATVTGITIYPSGSTITGQISLYGYNK